MDWFGGKGIDTFYERELLTYVPEIKKPTIEMMNKIEMNTRNLMDRSKEFSMQSVISEYEQLLKTCDNLMKKIEKHKKGEVNFESFMRTCKEGKEKERIEKEESFSKYKDDDQFELYGVLSKLTKAMEECKRKLQSGYEYAIKNEKKIIDNWVKAEIDFLFFSEREKEKMNDHTHEDSAHGHEEDEGEEEYYFDEEEEYNQAKIILAEEERDKLSSYSIKTADVSFVQKNRLKMYEKIIANIQKKLSDQRKIIPGDMEIIEQLLGSKHKKEDLIANMIFAFSKKKEEALDVKKQLMLLNPEKEDVFLKRQNQYYDMVNKNKRESVDWLYSQSAEEDEGFSLFADILADSIEEASDFFEETNAQLLGFYKNESILYDRLLFLIEKKEQIREFIRILEKLKEY
jgi:hypothetical protein